jgi:hypothetical protein
MKGGGHCEMGQKGITSMETEGDQQEKITAAEMKTGRKEEKNIH